MVDLEFLYPETWEIDEDPDSRTIMIRALRGFPFHDSPRDLNRPSNVLD